MHSTYQITGNDLARTLIGLTVKAQKPVRDTSLQAAVMAEAHSRYRMFRESHKVTKCINGRWQNVPADYNAADFGNCLRAAWNYIKAKRHQEASRRGEAPMSSVSITDDQARFIGSDSRWR